MQTIAIYIILAAAVFYISRRIYMAVSKKHNAAGCAHCDPDAMSKLKKPAHGK